MSSYILSDSSRARGRLRRGRSPVRGRLVPRRAEPARAGVALGAVHDALNPSEAYVLSAALVIDDQYSAGCYRGLELRQPRPRFRIEIVVMNDLATPDVVDAIERQAAEVGEKKCLMVVTSIDDVIQVPRN